MEVVKQNIFIGSPNGTLQAFGREWPTFSRPVLYVKLEGYVEGEDADSLQAEVERRLEGLPFKVQVEQSGLISLSTEDDAEYEALLSKSLKEAGC
jgi:hypothetical protein